MRGIVGGNGGQWPAGYDDAIVIWPFLTTGVQKSTPPKSNQVGTAFGSPQGAVGLAAASARSVERTPAPARARTRSASRGRAIFRTTKRTW